MPNVRGYSDEERAARVAALRSKYAVEDTPSKWDTVKQVGGDLLRNAAGIPETALTLGTGLAAQAGTGLGTAAGVVGDVVRGNKPNWDAAAETATGNVENFTFAPRSQGAQSFASGLGQVMEPLDKAFNYAGEKTADITGSPALGAAVYSGLNFLDPEHLGATVSALKGSGALSRLIKQAGPSPGVSSAGRLGKQRGAWTAGDIADAPGDFSLRSPTIEAFTRLKPQEQKNLSGKQLMKALTREGAKKEELQWMGLDKVLDTDDVMSVDDVKKIAMANEPTIEHVQARSGGGTELDEDAINEAASEAVSNDDDLQYPVMITHREPGSRRFSSYDPASRETFSSTDEADQWLSDHKEEWKTDRAAQLQEDIGDYLSEEEIAGMDDDAKREWALNTAESDVDELLGEFSTESDYDAEPTNYEELHNYHTERIRENPADYGIEGGAAGAPDYGSYTVGEYGSKPESNYTVAVGKLGGEARFGRNMEEPGFLAPYQRAEEARAAAGPVPAEGEPQMSLLPDPDGSKAFQREALRRGQIAEDPNRSKFTSQSNLSHYRDLGKNQMYFTRETSRPAPEWGTVKQGIPRVSEQGLATATGEALPESNIDNPLAFLEEAQSDWYQKGRKTGWADPKDLEKVEKQKVDKVAQIEAFKQQAVGELTNLWRNPHIAELVSKGVAMDPDGYLARKLATWQEMQPGGSQVGDFDSPESLQMGRINVGRQIISELGQRGDASPEALQLLGQTQQGLDMLNNLGEIPGAEDLTPTGPMRETPQYTQLAMADALRRAVQEGKQYFGWTPGDVHAHRWGSESMQFAPSADNPRVMRARFGGGRSMDEQPGTVLEKFQERANELLDPAAQLDTPSEFNLDDPNLDKLLNEAVEANLNYGMSDYPDPVGARGKRAALIRKQMEELAAKAAAGERKAAHYSPRAVGYEQAYGPMEKHLADILRRSGVKHPEIRDIPMRGGSRGSELPMRGFEIDPDLARAAKRGFILPY